MVTRRIAEMTYVTESMAMAMAWLRQRVEANGLRTDRAA
jgi:hypothetical protein